ncbi:MAG: CRISPR-associated endonuclease Cas2 [Bacteroidota bacterium]
MSKIYLVSYDIESNRLRTKFAKKLLALGLSRIQYSLFMGNLSATLYDKMLEMIHQFWESAETEKDRIDVITLTPTQIEQMIRLGGEHLDMDYITGQKHTLII